MHIGGNIYGKENFGNLEVPTEAKDRIMSGINKSKSEEKNIIPFKIIRGIGLGIAACLACVIILANTSASFAMALEKIPVIGPLAKVVVFRTYENGTDNFHAHVDVPEIQNNDPTENNENIAATNKTIAEYADELIEMYENDLKASEGQGNYELESTYQVIRETDDYLAIEIDTLLVMASGTQYKKVFNIDKLTGNIVTLQDYFTEGSDYKTRISNDIKRQMKEQMDADENIIYWIDSDMPEWDFKEITDETSFYFDENENLVILFDEYEVAPGYMGAVSFTIDKNVFEKMLSQSH